MILPPIGPPPLVLRADARCLPLADSSVDLVVTSPPYFGLRSYTDGGKHYEEQIGAEATPAEFVAALLDVTRECMRVLKPSGSIWVNLGDKYAQDTERSRNGEGARVQPGNVTSSYLGQTVVLGRRSNGVPRKSLIGIPWRYALRCIDDLGLILRAEVIWSKPNGLPESATDRVRRSHEQWFHFVKEPRYFSAVDEIREEYDSPLNVWRTKGKSMNGGAASGLASDRVGDQRNPLGKLPSSVWEGDDDGESIERGVLLATLSGSLTIDEAERILRGHRWTGWSGSGARSTSPGTAGSGRQDGHPRAGAAPALRPTGTCESATGSDTGGSAPRSVWTVPTEPLRVPEHLGVDHFAAFPSEFPRRIISGWSPRGVCVECGEGRRPMAQVERTSDEPFRPEYGAGKHGKNSSTLGPRGVVAHITSYACACLEPTAPTTPSVVLDPFGGTGTTAHVAHALGRQGISVDFSADYCRIARDPDVRGQRVAKVRGVKREKRQEIEGQADLFGEDVA